MYLLRRAAVQAPQDPVEAFGAAPVCAGTQLLPQFLRTLRSGEQSFQQSAQVKTRATHHNRQSTAAMAFLNHFSAHARVFPGGRVASRIHNVKQMMRNAGLFFRSGFGSADEKRAIE